jgi:hypothetical protein
MGTLRRWPGVSQDPFQRLTQLERFVLWSKLRSGRRRAVRVALRSRTLHQMWSTIKLVNDLVIVCNEVDY